MASTAEQERFQQAMTKLKSARKAASYKAAVNLADTANLALLEGSDEDENLDQSPYFTGSAQVFTATSPMWKQGKCTQGACRSFSHSGDACPASNTTATAADTQVEGDLFDEFIEVDDPPNFAQSSAHAARARQTPVVRPIVTRSAACATRAQPPSPPTPGVQTSDDDDDGSVVRRSTFYTKLPNEITKLGRKYF